MDQRGKRNQRSAPARVESADGYVTSDEAIAILGVKRETLYAYASRGLVRSVPGPRGRPRRYARADVERLRQRHDARAGHAAVAADALRWGEPVLDSALTEITPSGPRTRGIVLADAAREGARFETIAEGIWASGRGLEAWDEARQESRQACLSRALEVAARGIEGPRRARLLDRLVLVNAALGVLDPTRFIEARDAELARGRLSLVAFAAALALPDRSRAHQVIERDLPLAARALRALALRDEPSARRAMDAVLVTLADHELNASTFAARVTASAGADLHACLAAGLAAVSGPRHGGACDRVEALVHEVGTEHGSTRRLTSAVEAVIDARLGRGEAVAGFGHPLYPAGDPRARVLLAVARDLVRERGERGSSRAARTMLAIVDHMASIGGEPPSVDAGSVAITLALGAPRGTSAALFALGRTAGWVAHVLEQRGSATLLRPRARFTGASAGAGLGVSSAG